MEPSLDGGLGYGNVVVTFVIQVSGLRYIQFIGTQRSGSNLLRVMLNQLPEISAPHPPHILKTFVPLLAGYGDLTVSENLDRLTSDVCAWVNRNPVSWEPYVADPAVVAHERPSEDLLGIFLAISTGKARSEGAQIWCCKSMETVVYTEMLEQAGLKPLYIHLFRDGRDVALSFMKAVVGPKHIYALARKWEEEQRLALALSRQIPGERFFSLRYEDLIDQPEFELKRICAAIGVPFREEMLSYFQSGESERTARAGRMWENLSKPVMASNKEKFLRELSPDQLSVFEQVAGDVLSELGYRRVTSVRTGESFSQEQLDFFSKENKRLMEVALLQA